VSEIRVKKSPLQYPWISTLTGLLLAAYLYAASDGDVSRFYDIPPMLLHAEYKFGGLLIFVLAVAFDAYRFRQGKEKYDRQILKYEQQIKELFKTKNALQHKAHTYSDHADKLKLFISDRLLEYIEYDEKFLHFKNIASEVRHNGVICYDKVGTALRNALSVSEEEDQRQYQDALDAMRYLWDLLDLSTTDNIALYIANKLYESEEQFYQKLLAEDGEETPYTPTYSARAAIIKSLRAFVDRPDELAAQSSDKAVHYEDSRFLLDLGDGGTLLGNENYLVLLAENLINNALYYAGAKKSQHKFPSIAVVLKGDAQHTRLSIYNKGPSIGDDIKEQIFQLGFSTKRARDNHGKGLGLYFVQQIVKGYEGDIGFENIRNREDQYVIRVELENGEKRTEIVHTKPDKAGNILCHDGRCQELFPKVEHDFKGKIKSLSVAVQSAQQTYAFDIETDDAVTFFDPRHPVNPRWCLEINAQKTQRKLVFKPLDVTGVQFNVTLPTAESRLDAEYHERDGRSLPNLEELDEKFEGITQPYS
jgi:hypothetical protein